MPAKICPLNLRVCTPDCAWYDEETEKCAHLLLAQAMDLHTRSQLKEVI